MDFMVEGVRHGYRVEVDDSAVLYESLHSYPERRRRTLFEREGNDISFRRGLSGTSGTRKLLTPTTLALSAAIRLGDRAMGFPGLAIAGIDTLGIRPRWRARLLQPWFGVRHNQSVRLFLGEDGTRDASSLDAPDNRATALELLRFADPLIGNVEAEEDNHSRRGPLDQLRFVHHTESDPVSFTLDEESAGTQMWFQLLGPALGALERGQVLLFDEIDASLHPRLSARLLDLFQDPKTNPNGLNLYLPATTHPS